MKCAFEWKMKKLNRSPLLYLWCIFFIVINGFSFLLHKHVCHIDDFTICLWHLNIVNFTKSPMWCKKWFTLTYNYLSTKCHYFIQTSHFVHECVWDIILSSYILSSKKIIKCLQVYSPPLSNIKHLILFPLWFWRRVL
jgi:hypothetical protein